MFKRLLTFVLPLFLAVGAGLYFAPIEKAFAKTIPVKNSVQNSKKLVVYYIYGKPRCITCKKIEKYTREAVEENFSKEIKAGKVAFQGIDYDKPENKHFLSDYKLFTKSVIVSKKKNGKEFKYKNLDKIWQLTNNEKEFKDYIKNEVKSSLGK